MIDIIDSQPFQGRLDVGELEENRPIRDAFVVEH
jgi:hypothetical protein